MVQLDRAQFLQYILRTVPAAHRLGLGPREESREKFRINIFRYFQMFFRCCCCLLLSLCARHLLLVVVARLSAQLSVRLYYGQLTISESPNLLNSCIYEQITCVWFSYSFPPLLLLLLAFNTCPTIRVCTWIHALCTRGKSRRRRSVFDFWFVSFLIPKSWPANAHVTARSFTRSLEVYGESPGFQHDSDTKECVRRVKERLRTE